MVYSYHRTSLEEGDANAFSRDAFGRQSMSEKRHAALDAKNTDTYQRNKKLRYESHRQVWVRLFMFYLWRREERERQRQMQTEQQHMNDRRRDERMNGHSDPREGTQIFCSMFICIRTNNSFYLFLCQ